MSYVSQVLNSSEKEFLSQIYYHGDGVMGDAEIATREYIAPYVYEPDFVKKTSIVSQYQQPGFLAFQCIKTPPDLVINFRFKEGIFSSNELFYKLLNKSGFDETIYADMTSYYNTYKSYFNSPEAIVQYVKPFGITTNEGLTEDEKHKKSNQTQYCIFGKLNHPVFFQKRFCEGIIKCNQFLPVPNYKLYGDVYVFLAFDKNKQLNFYFTDVPSFDNISQTDDGCPDDMMFSFVLKLGHFQPKHIRIQSTFIHGVEFYAAEGFVFCPDRTWKFYYNTNYSGKLTYIRQHHPEHMYVKFSDFI